MAEEENTHSLPALIEDRNGTKLGSRCPRRDSRRARIPAQWCGSGRAGRLAALDSRGGRHRRRGIEVPHGPVVDTLIDRGFVVHAINPKQLDRLRDRFSVAGAKDDRRDAYVLADGVRTDRRLFRQLHVNDPQLIELRAWSRLAEELQQERVRLSNRVHHQLWRYYPQMPMLTDDLAAPWFLELWTLAPTPAKARHLRQVDGRAIA